VIFEKRMSGFRNGSGSGETMKYGADEANADRSLVSIGVG
jgi:hypothetical protein